MILLLAEHESADGVGDPSDGVKSPSGWSYRSVEMMYIYRMIAPQ